MHRWCSRWFLALVLCLPVAWVASAWAEEAEGGTAAEEKAEAEGKDEDQPAHKQISDREKARFQENLAQLEQRLQKLQMEELQLEVQLLKAQDAAKKLVKQPHSAAKRLMLACAAQLQKMEGEYARLYRSAKSLERQRDRMPEELKARAETVLAKVWARRRINLDKIAGFYAQAAEHKQALRVYRTIRKEVPQDLANLNHMVAMYQKMGDYKQALALYLDIHRQSPKDVKNLRNMAAMYKKLGDYKKALEKYKEVAEQKPEDITNTTDLGRMYAKLGAYKRAVAAYDKVAKKMSGNIGWAKKLAGLYEEVGAWQKALALYQKAYEHCTPEQREKDKKLKQAIDRLRKKLGRR